MIRRILLAPILLAACNAEPSGPIDDVDVPREPFDESCSSVFQQDVVPEYHVTISDAEWAALEQEFLAVVDQPLGEEETPYHPVEFHAMLGGQRIDAEVDVLLRLKGSSSWRQTVDLDPNPKMQFVLAFNEVDPEGRFEGVRKIELDMPRVDQTFLHQRVALSFMREVGLPAQCANNARLYINGQYYGLYTNLERLDKEFLQRNYGADDNGDLWKSGRIIKTNEETHSWDRLDALWHMTSWDQMSDLVDVEASVREWAAEAVVGDADGYYNGRANFYLYDHPTRGFIWIPHDMDTALDWDFLLPDSSPVFPSCLYRWERDWHHYIMAMGDPVATEQYASAIADVRDSYDPEAFEQRIALWATQIAQAAADDSKKPFTMDAHYLAVERMRSYVPARAAYIDEWLACNASGNGADEDGDGYSMCRDCNDLDETVRPGAPETCNLRDDDCDGHTDSVAGVSVCE